MRKTAGTAIPHSSTQTILQNFQNKIATFKNAPFPICAYPAQNIQRKKEQTVTKRAEYSKKQFYIKDSVALNAVTKPQIKSQSVVVKNEKKPLILKPTTSFTKLPYHFVEILTGITLFAASAYGFKNIASVIYGSPKFKS